MLSTDQRPLSAWAAAGSVAALPGYVGRGRHSLQAGCIRCPPLHTCTELQPRLSRPAHTPTMRAARRAGQFYECLNMAALYKLPCIFVVENNKWAIGMNHPRATGPSYGDEAPYIYKKGPAFGMPGVLVDGMDVRKARPAWPGTGCPLPCSPRAGDAAAGAVASSRTAGKIPACSALCPGRSLSSSLLAGARGGGGGHREGQAWRRSHADRGGDVPLPGALAGRPRRAAQEGGEAALPGAPRSRVMGPEWRCPAARLKTLVCTARRLHLLCCLPRCLGTPLRSQPGCDWHACPVGMAQGGAQVMQQAGQHCRAPVLLAIPAASLQPGQQGCRTLWRCTRLLQPSCPTGQTALLTCICLGLQHACKTFCGPSAHLPTAWSFHTASLHAPARALSRAALLAGAGPHPPVQVVRAGRGHPD